jgi:SAM-dependent methyltransferase
VSLQDFTSADWDDPFEIDTSVAHPARRYNYWLGGDENFEADRISGDTLAAAFPAIKIAAIENRRFLRRAVTYLVEEAGIRQFLDIGTGIPAADNVHEVAQSIDPKTRVVYADNDPIVLAHARRLLASTPAGGATAYIHADLHEPAAILDNADLRATLDLSRPVALMLIWVLHFFQDADDPYERVATLTDALAPGSHLVISHATADFMTPEMRAKIDAAYTGVRSRDPFQFRDRAAFARFFDGMAPIAPGIGPISDWRNDVPPDQRVSAADTGSYGAVARIG